jgi:NIPSNAP
MLQRRQFLQASTAASCLLGTSALAAAAEGAAEGRDYYEQRTYQVPDAGKRQLVSDYLQQAMLPALRRLGIGPVGVFTELGDAPSPALHLLITYRSLDQFAGARWAMEADTVYQAAAADYLDAQPDDPSFQRIRSSLLVAITAMPRLVVPEGKPRVFEWRLYESASEARARRKIEMFNSGEIPIFVEAGFTPVLFGEVLVGPKMPNLGYLLASPDMPTHEAHWAAFQKHPAWLAMKDLPQYQGTVSKVTNVFVTPTEYSQI